MPRFRAGWLMMHFPNNDRARDKPLLIPISKGSPLALKLAASLSLSCTGNWSPLALSTYLMLCTSIWFACFQKAAVVAGLTLPQSNGPLEGNVNRLKLMKRSVDGRAEIDLLKLHVLYHRQKSQDRKKKKQGQQGVRVRKPKIMKNGVNFQHNTTRISKVA